MTDYEKLGQFYLGRTHDLKTGVTSPDQMLMYESRDLTTHAVCVGMTGSGKTGLCLALLEEAALDGIPAICIDPKGDLGNLMLTFPHLQPADFEPWVDAQEATRNGMTTPEFAKKTADMWRKGLADWGQSGERIQKFRDHAEVAIYTPASSAGRQITVLKSFDAPNAQVLDDSEAFRERIMSAVSGLLALLQVDADPISSREHILLSTIFDSFWRNGQNIDMGALIRSIQAPPFNKVGFLDLESFYPQNERFKLAMTLNNLLASPSFAAWLEGEPLDIQKLMYTADRQAAPGHRFDRTSVGPGTYVLCHNSVERNVVMDAQPDRHVQSACVVIYGRSLRLFSADRQPAVEAADVDAAETGSRVWIRHCSGDAESGGSGL
jgi:hypothetical protein